MERLDRRGFLVAGTTALVGAAVAPRLAGAEAAPAASAPAEVKTAGIRLIRVDGKYNVWTKRVGSGKVKMLTLHGGPGATHEYLECFEDFLPQAGIEFYYYDQLGSFYSDQPDDPTLWTIPRFREEVEQVRTALGLEEYYLYGSSWGGMLGMEYALSHQDHLKALIISDMTASIPAYMAHAAELRAALPAEIRAVLDKYEAAGNYQAPEYQEAMLKEVYSRHLCRLDPWPDPVARAFKHFNDQVYNTLQGPNEFVITGRFKAWDRWADLPKITVPTLLIVGRHDTMSVDDIKRMGTLIPHSRVVVCENGSHLCMWDDQQTYFRELIQFVRDVESARFPGRG